VSIDDAPRAPEFLDILRQRVSERTRLHCISTAEYMASFAEAASINREDAVTAGLLHDMCKAMSDEELLAAAERYNVSTNNAQQKKPSLLHGPIAAEECARNLNVDPAICDAIRWHTTGSPKMGSLGLALYVADFSEPLRKYPEASITREILIREGFQAALRHVSRMKLEHIRRKPYMDPSTEAFHAWLASELP
jgi:predicted HD superfamily hydrolase involved in NAD metabolism